MEPARLVSPDQLRLGALRKGEEVEGVGAVGVLDLVFEPQPLQGVLPHTLQQTVADLLRIHAVHLNEALVDQRGQLVEHRFLAVGRR
jgi:hypothetical protein